jgi:hypothetical protein
VDVLQATGERPFAGLNICAGDVLIRWPSLGGQAAEPEEPAAAVS